MYNSILQLAYGLTEKICKRAEKGEIEDLDVMASSVLEDCKDTSREMIKVIIETLNQEIRQDKARRKEMGLVIKEKDRPRELLTELGVIDFERDYFYDRKNQQHTAFLDRVMGIGKYERIGGAVGAKLVTYATEQSYAKASSIVTGGAVSRQSVRNFIVKMEVPEMDRPEEQRKIEELHVYADEGHVHMQRPGKKRGKENRIVPLVTVTEGSRHVSKHRNQTIRPVHFMDEGLDTKNLWRTVEGYIDAAYDVETIKKIYLHADGGNWIRNGLDSFPQTVHVMDGYHFQKELKKIRRLAPERNVKAAITKALEEDARERAAEYLFGLKKAIPEEERIQEFASYLLHHWDPIRERVRGGVPGSCTEAQVSHMISDRFSRGPMGWSKIALGKLSCAKAYRENGGTLTKGIFWKDNEKQEPYREYADRFIEEHLNGSYDFSLFDPIPRAFDGASGTQQLISGLGKMRDTLLQ